MTATAGAVVRRVIRIALLNCYERLLLLSFCAACQAKSPLPVPAKRECGEFKPLLQAPRIRVSSAWIWFAGPERLWARDSPWLIPDKREAIESLQSSPAGMSSRLGGLDLSIRRLFVEKDHPTQMARIIRVETLLKAGVETGQLSGENVRSQT